MSAVREQLSYPTEGGESSEGQTSNRPASHEPVPSSISFEYPSIEDRHRGWEVRMDSESGQATIPAACVSEVEVHALDKELPSRLGDIISEGIILIMRPRLYSSYILIA
jgi:hypothetical protein